MPPRPGFPGPGGPGTPPPKVVDPEFKPRLAAQLWSETFRTAFDAQLEDLRSFEKQSPAVVLGSTIPQDSTRLALNKALRKHWTDGPKTLETAGWLEPTITDPGLLVLVKLNRGKVTLTAPKPPGAAPPAPPPGPGGASSKRDAILAERQKKDQMNQDWLAVSAKLMTTWCRRLHATVVAREKAAAESGKPIAAAPTKIGGDFALADNAKVLVAYHILWPEELPPALSKEKTSLLEVHYIRAEESAKMKKAITWYSNQARSKPADARSLDKSVWIDSPRPTASQADRRRSLDVLITRAADKTDSGRADPSKIELYKSDAKADAKEEEADLIVEVLSIEIKDLMKEPAARE
jgi:hypothetical protein